MQKLVLVDEFNREYKRLQRPAADVAKIDHSLRLSDTLRNSSQADDRKVRPYVGELHRYLNFDNRAPARRPPRKINWLIELELHPKADAAAVFTPTQTPRRELQTLPSFTNRYTKKEESEKKTAATRQATVGSVWTAKIVWMSRTPILAHPEVSVTCRY